MNIKNLKELAREVSTLTLDISYRAKTGHIGSCLSISDLLTVLYFSEMNISKKSLSSNRRDRFILSKGHAAAALYAILYKKNILSKKRLNSFGFPAGLCEHPEITEDGIEMTTGSLGHGLAFGTGIAIGLKKLNLPNRVYVLISDGECGEGSVWEAALLASRLKLDNLVILLDYNKWQCFGPISEVTSLEPLLKKWEDFGWGVEEIDGHNLTQIKKVLGKLSFQDKKPNMIIAHTISGHGVSFIENKLIGHYKVFSQKEYEIAKKELLKR